MMNDPAPVSSAIDQERLLVALAYGLYLISVAGGLPLLAGVFIALVRKPHARGTNYESHYRNLILVFFVILAFAGIMLAAALLAGLLNLLFAVHRAAIPGVLWSLPSLRITGRWR